MKDKCKLQTAWERFVSDKVLDPELNPIIAKSWIRSHSYGVDPNKRQGAEPLKSSELNERLGKNKELVTSSLPLMDQLYSFVRSSDFMVTLCDPDGYLLKVIGDEEPLRSASKILFVEGANWSEEAVGTNAIGTCLKINRPIQIFASEHYSKACQNWTCSASPIHGTKGEIIGVLNMSGPFEKVHPHTLGMVVSTVTAIENKIHMNEKNRKNRTMQRYLEATMNALSESVIIIGCNNEIIMANQIFLDFVGLPLNEVIRRPLLSVCGSEIFNISRDNTEVVDREIDLRLSSNAERIHVLLNMRPIFDASGTAIGSLVTLKEMSKVRQFINKMTGSQAKVTFSDIVGKSPAFLDSLKEAKLAAESDATVLLTGESGTGKDLFAQAIHMGSLRRGRPFIAINCGAIPRDLLGSELFGYVEGAFTGAKKGGNAGKFELADGGTLFLDEVGEMSLEMQVHLLRVLQSKEVIRIGGDKVVPIDVRIIAATNKDLKQEVEKGNFRTDLFYRLNVMPIRIPSLRERKSDIPLLAKKFTRELSHRMHRTVMEVSSEFMSNLEEWHWPGNVRELQNVLERAILRTNGAVLTSEYLPVELKKRVTLFSSKSVLRLSEQVKKRTLIQSIEECNGNYKAAAKYLGISRSTLYRQLEKYGLK